MPGFHAPDAQEGSRLGFLAMEDRIFEHDNTLRDRALNCWSYAELFGTPDDFSLPFGNLMKAILNVADLVVGVPAGPYHLAMVKPELPTIGVWAEHFPSWYDEPKEASLHLLSRNLRDHGIDKRVGSIYEMGEAKFKCWHLDSRIIPGESVLNAAEELLGHSTLSSRNLRLRDVPLGIEATSEIPHSGLRNQRSAKILVAICSCRRNHAAREQIRNTWLQQCPNNIDYTFFVGTGDADAEANDILPLDINDIYPALPAIRRCSDRYWRVLISIICLSAMTTPMWHLTGFIT